VLPTVVTGAIFIIMLW